MAVTIENQSMSVVEDLHNSSLSPLFNPTPTVTWTMRLQENNNWLALLGYGLGMVMCLLVISISLFSKRIAGDYKWFIINQAIANFLFAMSSFLWVAVVNVCMGPLAFVMLWRSENAPLWTTVFAEVIARELQAKLGNYAKMTTLLVTVFSRWVGVAFPFHYEKLMTPRLIFLYCSLSYLFVLPMDPRLFSVFFSNTVIDFLTLALFILPLSISTILSAMTYRILRKRLSTVTNRIDRRRLKESRSILRGLFVQIVEPLLDQIPLFVSVFVEVFCASSTELLETGFLHFIGVIASFNLIFSPLYTSLIILFAMKPYREAVAAMLSPSTSVQIISAN